MGIPIPGKDVFILRRGPVFFSKCALLLSDSSTITKETQGSRTFLEMKLKDFSMTFQGQNYIFKHYRMVSLCIVWALFCEEITCHTQNCNIRSLNFNSIQSVCCGTVYKTNCILENMDHQINSDRIVFFTLTWLHTVYPKKYAHGFCFAVLCCGYTLTDFPISIRLTSLALWQSNDCPSASKATLMNMDKYFMWINYERLYNHNKAKHNKTVCIFHGIYCNHIACICGRYVLLHQWFQAPFPFPGQLSVTPNVPGYFISVQ